jgi:hypothetical protein
MPYITVKDIIVQGIPVQKKGVKNPGLKQGFEDSVANSVVCLRGYFHWAE